MLRNDTLKTIQAAIARGDSVIPTPDQVRALQHEAHRLRARELQRWFSDAIAWLRSDLTVSAGKIDVVRGH